MNLSLYAIVGTLENAEAAAKGGASVVQLRNKSLSDRDLLKLAIEIKNVLDEYKTPLIINDRIDIALASGASGVHLGQKDLSPSEARRLGGNSFCIGITIDTEKNLDEANTIKVDYVALGPVFATQSKVLEKQVLGLNGFKELRAKTHHKVVAIGGINDSNAASVVSAGADGIAVLSYIADSSNKVESVLKLKKVITEVTRK